MRWLLLVCLFCGGCRSLPARESYGLEAEGHAKYENEQPIGEVTIRLFARIER